jgi:aldose 1-epimerase
MIKFTPFGKTPDGKEAKLYHLKNGDYSADITDFGATLVSFSGPDRDGKETDVLLGFDSVEQYAGNTGYMGALIGRFGNRIEKGKFTLNGKEFKLFINNGPNHLHGGKEGFSHKFYDVRDIDSHTIEFSRLSADGEEGYPGNMDVQLTYSLSADGTLTLDYYAISDKDTVINLTNHAYFNLNGAKSGTTVFSHSLKLDSTAFCETDGDCLANGNILATRGTPFDFSKPAILEKAITADFTPAKVAGGIDHNFIISGNGYREFGVLYSDKTGIEMTCYTDQPGVQIYTGNAMNPIEGKYGVTYAKHGAICLETQGFPNSTTFAHFPSPVLKKGEIYRRTTAYKLSVR